MPATLPLFLASGLDVCLGVLHDSGARSSQAKSAAALAAKGAQWFPVVILWYDMRRHVPPLIHPPCLHQCSPSPHFCCIVAQLCVSTNAQLDATINAQFHAIIPVHS